MSNEKNKVAEIPKIESPDETKAEAAPKPNEADNVQTKDTTDVPPGGKSNEQNNISSKSGSLSKLLAEELDSNIPYTNNKVVKKDEEQPVPEDVKDDNDMTKKPKKTSDEVLDEIIDDEMNKMKGAGKKAQDGKETSEKYDDEAVISDDTKGKEGQIKEEDAKDAKKGTDKVADEKDSNATKGKGGKEEEEDTKDVEKGADRVADDIYPGNYCIQDDVRFLKFVSNMNEQACTCNAAGNDFVLEDCGTNYHKPGCPSSLSPKDIESIKVIFLVRHLPVCKRFLTQNERQVLKNILKTAPYYQMEFYNRHSPYEIQSDGQDLIQNHMVDERKFPKKEDEKDMSKVKKTILDDLKDNVKPTPPATDGNLNRFPVEDYKFGEKYQNRPKERPIDINDHPYDKPQAGQTPSQNQRNKNNAEIMDERLILNLLNDVEAWNCFTSICICDVLQTDDEGSYPESDNNEINQLKAVLLEGVPPEKQKVLSGKIDTLLEYFDGLLKARLKEKIEREREYMQLLCDGKLKKEQLFVEILTYKNKNAKKNPQEVSMIVNDMFRELIRNNKDIERDMDNRLKKENEFMARDILNKMRLKVSTDLKLGHPKNQLLEQYIQDVLHNKFDQEYDLIKYELEYELERCDEKSLRLLKDLVNQLTKDRAHEYDLNEYFKALYPPSEKPSSPYSVSSASGLYQTAEDRTPSPEPSRGKLLPKEKNYTRDSKPEYDSRKPSNVTYDDVENIGKSKHDQEPRGMESRDPRLQKPTDRRENRDPSRMREPVEKRRPEKYETPRETSPLLEQRRPVAQTTPSNQKPKSLTEDIDRIMEEIWNDNQDKEDLIRQLVNELKRYDLHDQNPQEKALLTKKSYRDFKENLDSKMKSSDRRSDRSVPNRQPLRPVDTDMILTLSDHAFQYIILEFPMREQRIQLYHDSFYKRNKTLAEITVLPEAKQIRTDIVMNN